MVVDAGEKKQLTEEREEEKVIDTPKKEIKEEKDEPPSTMRNLLSRDKDVAPSSVLPGECRTGSVGHKNTLIRNKSAQVSPFTVE